MPSPRKIVLAYSGGLDTSIIVHWLKDRYDGCEVHAYCGDVGQGQSELEGLEDKANDIKRKMDALNEKHYHEATNLFRMHEVQGAGLSLAKVIEDVECVIDPDGAPFLPRNQDLKALGCFADAKTASEMWLRNCRNVYVLSYGWRMGGMPDPDGKTLEAVRKALWDEKARNPDIDMSKQLLFLVRYQRARTLLCCLRAAV